MTTHEQWLELLKKFPGDKLTLPPPTLRELGLEYIEITPGKLIAKAPFQERFTNPVGLYQGGMLAACIDEVFGPLSYMTAKAPCMTISMNTTYLGAFKKEMGSVLIEGTVLKQTRNFIFMRAEVKTHEGELIAHAETHVKVLV